MPAVNQSLTGTRTSMLEIVMMTAMLADATKMRSDRTALLQGERMEREWHEGYGHECVGHRVVAYNAYGFLQSAI